MAEIKKTFENGIMNKDLDERLVPSGFYRHAENVIIDSVQGSDLGVIKNLLSNKKITNLNLGENPKVQNGFSDETEKKIYYFVLSDAGSFLIEYDDNFKSASFVLHDTREIGERVFNLKDDFRVTSVQKIYNDNTLKNLLIWTNNDMEICCVNIERAKGYGENGFSKEDILLIKKPPYKAPEVKFLYSQFGTNEIEEKFILFAYRYKYLDGEYSALSPFSSYNFSPKSFEMDFETLENKSMVNNFTTLGVSFNTGEKQVTDIQIITKFSNSNNLYIVETINKKIDGIENNVISNIIYNNKKLYTLLPENEIYRLFDNVPRKAKALTLIGNRIALGNYTEGYDFVSADGRSIKLDYTVGFVSKDLDDKINIPHSLYITENNESFIKIEDTSTEAYQDYIISGSKLEWFLRIINPNNDGAVIFERKYSFNLNQNYNSLTQIFQSSEFNLMIETINNEIAAEFIDLSLNSQIEIQSFPQVIIQQSSLTGTVFKLSNLEYNYEGESLTANYNFSEENTFALGKISNPTSLKSNKDYELGLLYQDEFKRSSTVITKQNNTVFIPISSSTKQNQFVLDINHKPPYWAKNYRIAVKSKSLDYETIYVNRFYNEDGFTWAKLEGDNKDKVKANDVLLVKRTTVGPLQNVIKVKVLEVSQKERDFIPGNTDNNGSLITEESGLYMKIKPQNFSMSVNDYEVYQFHDNKERSGSGNYPETYVDLFSKINENDEVSHLFLPTGSVIELFIKSSQKPDSGWKDNILNRTFYIDHNYTDLGTWFNQNIVGINLWGNEGNDIDNYNGSLTVVKGILMPDPHMGVMFFPMENGKYYLKVVGTKPGMTQGRYGYLEVKLNVRTSDGFYVFETQPKKEVDLDVFYLTSDVFDVENGLHKGNIEDQTDVSAAKLQLDFFNCFSFGNGVESYKIKDGFNENFLNIDYSPSSTSIEAFKETVRNSDITWSGVYNESSNINSLNEFNAANLNWKELDKQNGKIELLHSREGNILVIQEDKWGQVLYGKDAIYTAEGEGQILTSSNVLGSYLPYSGKFGITDVESFKQVGNRCYGVDKKRGAVLRLSIDGINEITTGMKSYFKTTFQERNSSNVIGGLDPFNDTYQLCIDQKKDLVPTVHCGQTIIRSNIIESFIYEFELNDIMNDITLNYNITSGVANIIVNGALNHLNLSNQGTITIPRNFVFSKISVEIIPVSSSVDFEITNNCPIGNPLQIVTIVRNSHYDNGKVFSKGLIMNGINYRDDVVLLNSDYSLREVLNGSEGIGKFPSNGELVTISTYFDSVSTKTLDVEAGNKISYLISDVEYDFSNDSELFENAIPLQINEFRNQYRTAFIYNRVSRNDKIYIIYDLRNYIPTFNFTEVTINFNPQIFYTYDMIYSNLPIESMIVLEQGSVCYVSISENQFIITYNGDIPQNDTDQFKLGLMINGVLHEQIITINVNINE